ncbi:MAG: HD domain-containing protein [bacterium]
MNLKIFRARLIEIARSQSRYADVAHDLRHTLRVLRISEKIGLIEKADLDILLPAAIFHDVIISPKHHPRARSDSIMSADFARKILCSIRRYPEQKIEYVCAAIAECAFTKESVSHTLEGRILQDADRLDALGALGIMRAFATTGQLRIPFYHENNPFCRKRKPDPKLYGVDFFFTRLLKLTSGMHTVTGLKLAKQRTGYIRKFLTQLDKELNQSNK